GSRTSPGSPGPRPGCAARCPRPRARGRSARRRLRWRPRSRSPRGASRAGRACRARGRAPGAGGPPRTTRRCAAGPGRRRSCARCRGSAVPRRRAGRRRRGSRQGEAGPPCRRRLAMPVLASGGPRVNRIGSRIGPHAALEEVVVLDFSRILAGPLATMLLGDYGATVIKVERPGSGDDTRSWTPPRDADGTATYFLSVNRNKRSVALDLTDPDQLETAHELAGLADVVVENFRPRVMERLGLGYERLSESAPGLIYCSITGFGTGPGARMPGYDLLVQALGGLMSITGS